MMLLARETGGAYERREVGIKNLACFKVSPKDKATQFWVAFLLFSILQRLPASTGRGRSTAARRLSGGPIFRFDAANGWATAEASMAKTVGSGEWSSAAHCPRD